MLAQYSIQLHSEIISSGINVLEEMDYRVYNRNASDSAVPQDSLDFLHCDDVVDDALDIDRTIGVFPTTPTNDLVDNDIVEEEVHLELPDISI